MNILVGLDRSHNYKNYGGRGISVCDRWKDSFENFYEDMGPRPSSEYSIDRTNNDGNYEPANCEWRTDEEQIINKSISKIKGLEEADYIREVYKTGEHTQYEIADKYKCRQPHISRIINNKRWIE